MGSMFSSNYSNQAKRSAPIITDRDRAELGLKNSRDKLQKFKKSVSGYIYI